MELEALARSVLWNAVRLPAYMDGVVQELLNGTGTDPRWDSAMWYIHKAWVECEEHKAFKGYGSYDNEELVVMALMAADGVEPTEDEDKQRKYLEELARRLNMPELVNLYYVAKFGPEPRKFFSGAFKEWEEMTDEEKKFFNEQKKASYDFMITGMKVISMLFPEKNFSEVQVLE